MSIFLIEDDIHAEPQGRFGSLDGALAELRRRASAPWDQEPNRPPCTDWATCEREYVVIEYDTGSVPWQELASTYVLSISAAGPVWHCDPETGAGLAPV